MAADRLPQADVPRGSAARRATRSLPGAVGSVPSARRFVREVLAAWGRQEFEESGALLVSELVGNAVLHARSEVDVEVADLGADGVLLSVSDGSPALPVVRRHSRDAATGRGLWLLTQYSAQHGVVRTRTGKQVWAVLCPETDDAESGTGAALARWLDESERR